MSLQNKTPDGLIDLKTKHLCQQLRRFQCSTPSVLKTHRPPNIKLTGRWRLFLRNIKEFVVFLSVLNNNDESPAAFAEQCQRATLNVCARMRNAYIDRCTHVHWDSYIVSVVERMRRFGMDERTKGRMKTMRANTEEEWKGVYRTYKGDPFYPSTHAHIGTHTQIHIYMHTRTNTHMCAPLWIVCPEAAYVKIEKIKQLQIKENFSIVLR